MELINKYFKELTDVQRHQFELLGGFIKNGMKKSMSFRAKT